MICAIGLLISSPLLFAASLFAPVNGSVCFALIFFGEVFLNLNWSIVADILLVSTHRIFFISCVTDLGISGAKFILNCYLYILVSLVTCEIHPFFYGKFRMLYHRIKHIVNICRCTV